MKWFQQNRALGTLLIVSGVCVLLGAALLYWLAGPPHLPDSVPSWASVRTALGSADVPGDAIVYLFATAAWALALCATHSKVPPPMTARGDR